MFETNVGSRDESIAGYFEAASDRRYGALRVKKGASPGSVTKKTH